jgi:hypothetical protein
MFTIKSHCVEDVSVLLAAAYVSWIIPTIDKAVTAPNSDRIRRECCIKPIRRLYPDSNVGVFSAAAGSCLSRSSEERDLPLGDS